MFFRKRSRADSEANSERPVPTVIGRDSALEGTIESNGEVRIDGTVKGAIRAVLCVVGPEGLVEGGIHGEEVRIAGRVTGPIRARHVHLLRGAQVDGDIVNQTLSVDGGAEINGAVWRSDDPLGNPTPAELPSPSASSALFGETLWPRRDNDDARPLLAVRPRR